MTAEDPESLSLDIAVQYPGNCDFNMGFRGLSDDLDIYGKQGCIKILIPSPPSGKNTKFWRGEGCGEEYNVEKKRKEKQFKFPYNIKASGKNIRGEENQD